MFNRQARLGGKTVAVKRFGFGSRGPHDTKGRGDFAREVEVMARLRHGNLLPLLAYCDQGDERIIIYAFMQNKSLDTCVCIYIYRHTLAAIYILLLLAHACVSDDSRRYPSWQVDPAPAVR